MTETVPKASLGMLCDLTAGGTPSTSDLSLWSDDPVVGHPWIAIGDMSRRKNVSSAVKHVSDKGLKKARLPVGEPGTVLFAIYASVGETAILDIRATWNQAILGLSPKDKTKLDSKFLYYALLNLRPELPIHYRSNTQHNLNAETVSRLQIPLPSLGTQQRIADYLDRETGRIDAMIGKLDRLAATLQVRRTADITRATIGVDFDSRQQTGDIWIPEIPSGWRLSTVNKLAERVTDGSHVSPETENGVFDFVSTRDITDGVIDFEGSLKTSEESYNALVRGGCQPFGGDLLYSKDGTIGETAIVRGQHDFVVASSLIIVTPDVSTVDVRFLNYALLSEPAQDAARSYSRGAGLPRLSIWNFGRGIPIPVPPLEEQRRIADHLDEITSKIDAMLDKVAQLKNLLTERRAALITAVVTGRKDVA